jgi:outer membrane protein TolC
MQYQEATLKSMLVKKVSPQLDAARIVLKDHMPQPSDLDVPDMQAALTRALGMRQELKQAEVNIQNQNISVDFTEEALKPTLSVFGFYAGSGLQGTSSVSDSGLMDAFGQGFKGKYPEYAGGLSLNIPIRNRTAQADSLRSQLEKNQLLISQQQSRNTIAVEVRKAIIGLIQGKAQVEAAHKATALAREIWEGEKAKLDAGASDSYQVILRERDFISAEQAEVAAMITYAKAIVEMDRSQGITLDRCGIQYADGLSGRITKAPISPFGNGGNREDR